MIDSLIEAKIIAMSEGGKKLGTIREELLALAKPGVSLFDIESLAMKRIKEEGGVPSFTTVGDYEWATCLCINDEVVHGIPRPIQLTAGDVFTVDVGMIYKGFHTDTAGTVIVHGSPASPASGSSIIDSKEEIEKKRFLSVGQVALEKAIQQARPGNKIGHISLTIQKEIEGAGYTIIKSLVGHGVGKSLHEDPQIPGFLRGNIDYTPPLMVGMTIAIEVIYSVQSSTVINRNGDGWTLSTRDGSLSAVFEHTIAITASGPMVLTLSSS